MGLEAGVGGSYLPIPDLGVGGGGELGWGLGRSGRGGGSRDEELRLAMVKSCYLTVKAKPPNWATKE